MNKNRIILVIASVLLILVVGFAIQDLQSRSSAQKGQQSGSVGMGDVQRLDSEQAVRNSTGPSQARAKAPGFGDIQRYDYVRAMPSSAATHARLIGIGDLRQYEALQSRSGESRSKNRICSNQSSLDGERDAGASAPAHVLKAQGCQ